MNSPSIDTDHLLIERDGGIITVTFNRPDVFNAMTFEMYDRLAELCHSVNADPSVRTIVLTGAGKAFVAGTDIAQFRSFKQPSDASGYEARIEKVLSALESVHVPTIAALNGATVGGGAGLAACCDIRIGTPPAKYGFPVARTLGNCLSMGNYTRLVALVGVSRVKDMLMTARLLEANECISMGLYKEIVERDALLPRAYELAREIATFAPLTLQVTKEALRRIKDRMLPPDSDHDLLLTCYSSNDFREGVSAFLDKRPPQWTGT